MITKQCKRCLYTNDHPLGLIIDEEEICSGCRIHEEKDKLNWDERWNILKKISSNIKVAAVIIMIVLFQLLDHKTLTS